MSPWSPLICTTPLAPRAAPGSWLSNSGKLPAAGDLVSAFLLSVRSVPAFRTVDDAVTDTMPSCFATSLSVTSAPTVATSMLTVADPAVACAVTTYDPGVRFGNAKRPDASVCVRCIRLLPVADTCARGTGLPSAVTVPVRNVVEACAGNESAAIWVTHARKRQVRTKRIIEKTPVQLQVTRTHAGGIRLG